MNTDLYNSELKELKAQSNLRSLPTLIHQGRHIEKEGKKMLNLSSNDYLGLSSDLSLRQEFLEQLTPETFLPSASSSRLLTGNFTIYQQLEQQLCLLFDRDGALVFNSGYHANTGILPAVANNRTLILADKLVHASLIDGIRLSSARCIRYRYGDLEQAERLVKVHMAEYERIILVTESIFSMDGDITDLARLVEIKRNYSNVMLYVDEAHGIGLRGMHGLGLAEEQNCIRDIDFLVGTFGKALASVGAYVICDSILREYLINKMRTFIFTTALPPVNIAWTLFILQKLERMQYKRTHLQHISLLLRNAVNEKGYPCPSNSHIIPLIAGASDIAIQRAEELQRQGFYTLPVRPPTVPEGTSRIRCSLTADITTEEIINFIESIPNKEQ